MFVINSANKLRYDAEALRGRVGQIFENLAFSVKNRARRAPVFAPRSFLLFSTRGLGGGTMVWGTQAEGWRAKRAYRRDRRHRA